MRPPHNHACRPAAPTAFRWTAAACGALILAAGCRGSPADTPASRDAADAAETADAASEDGAAGESRGRFLYRTRCLQCHTLEHEGQVGGVLAPALPQAWAAFQARYADHPVGPRQLFATRLAAHFGEVEGVEEYFDELYDLSQADRQAVIDYVAALAPVGE